MPRRRIFYSFHYDNDVMRVHQIRNMGALEDNKPITANNWEEVKKKGKESIKNWIDENMKNRSCLVVLIGSQTAMRPWVKYEIKKAWENGKGVFGIYIHNIKCPRNGKDVKGDNPFNQFTFKVGEEIITPKCYNPPKSNAYSYIKENIEEWVEKAISQVSNSSR